MTQTSTALVVHAERDPQPVRAPGPHQTYRWPRTAIESRPIGPLGSDEIRVEMLLAGVCGTDLHVVRADPASGYILGSAPLDIGSDGRVLGHEGVGRVLEAGTAVADLKPGRIVTFESLVTCQTCASCRRGDFNHCRRARLIGLERDGLFRTVVDLPASIAHDVTDLSGTPEGLAGACCVEPAACACVAARVARVRPGDRVVVFGAGPIGLFAAMLCRTAFGAATVDVVEPLPRRRQVAAAWADRCFEGEEFFTQHEDEVDVLIEASGDAGNVDRAFDVLAPRARVVLLGRSGRPLTLSRVDRMITNGITIAGARGHLGGAFEDVLRLYRAGRVPLHEAVTGVVDRLEGIVRELAAPVALEHRHVKLLARLS
jgi:D-xylulose reductase